MSDSDPLVAETTSRNGRVSLLGLSASVPAIGTALLPAVSCPACWPAYAGLLSSLGLGFIDYSPWLMPLTIAFLAVALAALAWRGHKRRAYGPLVFGIVGSMVLVIGKFGFESETALYSGVVLVVGASVWNAWPRKTCPTTVRNNDFGCE